MKARRARPQIVFNGEDITGRMVVGSLVFTANAHGESDQVDITISGRSDLYDNAWFPSETAVIEVNILCSDWYTPGREEVLRCGSFSIDAIEDNGPPRVIVLRGQSVYADKALRRTRHTREWENTNLKSIASDIAGRYKMGLDYRGDHFPISRRDQNEKPDIIFLSELAEEYALFLSVSSNTILIDSPVNMIKDFAGTVTQVEAERSSVALSAGYTGQIEMSTWGLRHGIYDVYKTCKVSYHEPESTEEISFEVSDPAVKSGEVLMINPQVDSRAQAQTLARCALIKANRGMYQGQLLLMGRPELVARRGVVLEGWGSKFDRTYLAAGTVHTLDVTQGYTTQVRVLSV